MVQYLSVPNFEKWQHYKDRTPPWIKLHRDMLHDYDFSCLQDASKAHLVLIWLLASQMDNQIPHDARFIQNKIGSTETPDLNALISAGFLEIVPDCKQDASNTLADCKQLAMRETETETDKENNKKKNPPKRKPKIDLAEWEEKNGKLCLEMLSEFSEKHEIKPQRLGEMIETFRAKCKAQDYRYVDFANAFAGWEWEETKKKPTRDVDKPHNRMASPAGG